MCTKPVADVATYDQLRPYPALIGRQLSQRLIELVGRGARVLELGVGTGRLAEPLITAGSQVVSIDIAAGTAQRGATQIERATAVRGDVQHIPFATHSFDAGMAVDLLHLVPNGMAIVREVQRVLHPGTPLILASNWRDPTTIDARIRKQWLHFVGELVSDLPPTPVDGTVDLLTRLSQAGAQVEPEVALLEWNDQVSAATELDAIATRKEHPGQQLSDALLRQSVELVNEWMFTMHIDPHVTDIALREFRIVLIRWPIGAE